MALVTRDDDLAGALGDVYAHVLHDDVVARTIQYLRAKDGGIEHADELEALESRLRASHSDLPRMEAEGAARRLVDIAFFIAETFDDDTDA
jgi:hypothetical protein